MVENNSSQQCKALLNRAAGSLNFSNPSNRPKDIELSRRLSLYCHNLLLLGSKEFIELLNKLVVNLLQLQLGILLVVL